MRRLLIMLFLLASAFPCGCGLLVEAAQACGGLPSDPFNPRTIAAQRRLLRDGRFTPCRACGGSGVCPYCDTLVDRAFGNCRRCGGSRECPRCRGLGEE